MGEVEEGGLLSEAHNLIIQSIEQHIHFIVLQISSKLAGLIGSPSERNRAALCRKEGAADEISRLISQERRYCLFFSSSSSPSNALHSRVRRYDFLPHNSVCH